MAKIVDISGSRRLQLDNEEFARTFSFGQRWSRLKIGILFGVNGGATFSSTMLMGICSGTTNTFRSPTTDGWYGIAPVSYGAVPSWTWAAAPDGYSQAGTTKAIVTRIGSTVTEASVGSVGPWGLPSAPVNLGMYVFTIYRSPGWKSLISQSAYPTTIAAAAVKIESFQFYLNLDNDAGTSYWSMRNDDAVSTALAWTGGDLDSFSFVWGTNTPTIEIAHIGVMRIN
jgi:hypothetical protein